MMVLIEDVKKMKESYIKLFKKAFRWHFLNLKMKFCATPGCFQVYDPNSANFRNCPHYYCTKCDRLHLVARREENIHILEENDYLY